MIEEAKFKIKICSQQTYCIKYLPYHDTLVRPTTFLFVYSNQYSLKPIQKKTHSESGVEQRLGPCQYRLFFISTEAYNTLFKESIARYILQVIFQNKNL